MSSPSDLPLFRQQAIDALGPQLEGGITLTPTPSSRWVALVALALAMAMVALLVFGSYTRRTTVPGQLVPDEGLIRLSVPQPGVVLERKVKEGDQVDKGQVLLLVSGDRAGGAQGRDLQRELAQQIEGRKRLLEDDLRRLAQAQAVESEQLRRRLASLRDEGPRLARQIQEQMRRQALAEDTLARYRRLREQDVVTRDELAIREADAADQRARVDAVRREASAMEREAGAAQREIDAMSQRMQAQRSELERGILAARQELTEIDARRVMVVTATTAGRVSLVQAEPGQAVDAQRPLIHLVPDGANLVARLLVPSRAAGFVKPGMRVMLRYDSYPYQKFGQQEARVQSVSQVAVPASELNGLDAPVAGAPAGPGESLFAVTVALPARTLGDASRPLQAGMRLEADLMQETRRLYEWVLEPLFAARARVAA